MLSPVLAQAANTETASARADGRPASAGAAPDGRGTARDEGAGAGLLPPPHDCGAIRAEDAARDSRAPHTSLVPNAVAPVGRAARLPVRGHALGGDIDFDEGPAGAAPRGPRAPGVAIHRWDEAVMNIGNAHTAAAAPNQVKARRVRFSRVVDTVEPDGSEARRPCGGRYIGRGRNPRPVSPYIDAHRIDLSVAHARYRALAMADIAGSFDIHDGQHFDRSRVVPVVKTGNKVKDFCSNLVPLAESTDEGGVVDRLSRAVYYRHGRQYTKNAPSAVCDEAQMLERAQRHGLALEYVSMGGNVWRAQMGCIGDASASNRAPYTSGTLDDGHVAGDARGHGGGPDECSAGGGTPYTSGALDDSHVAEDAAHGSLGGSYEHSDGRTAYALGTLDGSHAAGSTYGHEGGPVGGSIGVRLAQDSGAGDGSRTAVDAPSPRPVASGDHLEHSAGTAETRAGRLTDGSRATAGPAGPPADGARPGSGPVSLFIADTGCPEHIMSREDAAAVGGKLIDRSDIGRVFEGAGSNTAARFTVACDLPEMGENPSFGSWRAAQRYCPSVRGANIRVGPLYGPLAKGPFSYAPMGWSSSWLSTTPSPICTSETPSVVPGMLRRMRSKWSDLCVEQEMRL